MNSYWQYLQDTLGLDHVILPARGAESVAVAAPDMMEEHSTTSATEVSHDSLLKNIKGHREESAAHKIETALHIDPTVSVHFQVVSAHETTAEEHKLFHKIMEALKLPSSAYILTTGTTEVDPKAAKTVIFTDFGDRFGEWIRQDDVVVMRTYSLHAMLQDAGLKKPVWNHLQTLKLH